MTTSPFGPSFLSDYERLLRRAEEAALGGSAVQAALKMQREMDRAAGLGAHLRALEEPLASAKLRLEMEDAARFAKASHSALDATKHIRDLTLDVSSAYGLKRSMDQVVADYEREQSMGQAARYANGADTWAANLAKTIADKHLTTFAAKPISELLRLGQEAANLSAIGNGFMGVAERLHRESQLSAIGAQYKALTEPLGFGLAKEFSAFGALGGTPEWQRRLTLGLESLGGPSWVLPDAPTQSLLGYAALARLRDVASSDEPFSDEVAAYVRSELGEARSEDGAAEPGDRDAGALAGGLRPELIAFPPSKFHLVLSAAGFDFSSFDVPLPEPIEGGGEDAVFDPLHGHTLHVVEQRLRQLIELRLRALKGARWEELCVHRDALARWKRGQQKARREGRSVYSALQYSNFLELATLIETHWAEAFRADISHLDEFLLALRQLHPIRNHSAHSRPIARSDAAVLATEATRILGFLSRGGLM